MAEHAGSQLLRILLVEDSEEDAELIEDQLRDAGYVLECLRVDTVDGLSRALIEQAWDIVLCDYNLPRFEGMKTIEMVRKRKLDTPVILVSGAIGEDRAVEALKAGAADFVSKQTLIRLPHAVERAFREVDERRENRAAQERARQLAAIVDSTDAAIIGAKLDGTITSWNQSAQRLYGYSAEEAIGRNIGMLSPVDTPDEIADILRHISAGTSVGRMESTRLRKDGQTIEVGITVSPVYDASGRIVGASSIGRDITALKQAEQLRRASDERYRSVVESALDGIVATDLLGVVTFANQKMAELIACDLPTALVGRQNLGMIAPEDREMAILKMREVVEHGSVNSVRCTIVRSDGTTFPAEMSGALICDDTGSPSGITATIRDVTDRVANEEQLQHLAVHDPLTGLPNRTLLYDRLEQALLNRHIADAPVTVLFIDLDEFKVINDTFGHHCGDDVLKEVSRRLLGGVRESDTVARGGGDEFLVVLPGADTAQALLVAENILTSLGEPIAVEDQQIVLSASIGIAARPDHGDEPSTLLRFADIAMYRAKRDKSGYAIYASAEDSPAIEHFALVRDLRRAIEQGELVLHYQPQLDIRIGCIRGAEALVRWQHPSRGLIFPDGFIGLAERAGLMKQLTAWVVGEAARQSAAWRTHGLEIAISVNLSAENLHDPELVAVISRSIESHGAEPSSLGVEITETSIMRQPDRALEIIHRLNALGIQIAIDDFGTGYSSLGYLKRFPAHELKIDKSFVLDMYQDESNAVIVSAIIDLGHKLGLQVVAEGVEDQKTLDHLEVAGCDIIQGYYVSRPLPVNAIEAWFRDPPPLVAERKWGDASAPS